MPRRGRPALVAGWHALAVLRVSMHACNADTGCHWRSAVDPALPLGVRKPRRPSEPRPVGSGPTEQCRDAANRRWPFWNCGPVRIGPRATARGSENADPALPLGARINPARGPSRLLPSAHCLVPRAIPALPLGARNPRRPSEPRPVGSRPTEQCRDAADRRWPFWSCGRVWIGPRATAWASDQSPRGPIPPMPRPQCPEQPRTPAGHSACIIPDDRRLGEPREPRAARRGAGPCATDEERTP